MLSGAAWSLPAASAGVASLAGGQASGFALAGLLAIGIFAALLGALTSGPAPAADAPRQAGISRPVALVCATALGLIGLLAGAIAWQVWTGQGPAPATGLVALSMGCTAAALTFGSLALRRR
jgi:hypothetical protein